MNEVDEGVLAPWVAEWVTANAAMMEQPVEYTPEYLAAARSPTCPRRFPLPRGGEDHADEVVGEVPVRIYEHDDRPTGLVVYFHSGAVFG